MNPEAPDRLPVLPASVVLVVDDAPANLALLLDCLGEAGLDLRFAENGEQALAQLDHARPDLILLDVLMPPGPDGFETCRRIRARPDGGDVPILFMTSLTDKADTLRGLAAGAVDYIAKPLHPEEVLARVRVHLQLQSLRRALEAEVGRRQRAEQQLREGLDRAVIVADRQGRIHFCSRPAREVLARHFGLARPAEELEGLPLPEPLGRLVESVPPLPTAFARLPVLPLDHGGSLRVRAFSEVSSEAAHVLLLLEELPATAEPAALMRLGLTAREAEVLFWIAHGKTGAEIAAILETTLATVKKHTEHVFDKLGVDSRTAAALKAVDVLGVPGTRSGA